MTDPNLHIDHYLLDRLSASDRSAFEKAMTEDDTLRQAVEERRTAMRAIELMGDAQLKEQIRQAIHSPAKVHRLIPQNGLRIVAAAASVGLLIMAYWFFTTPPATANLYASYYETYPINTGNRSDAAAATITKAVEAYHAGQYEVAIPQFASVYKTTKDSRWLLAQGICYMETEKYEEAVSTLAPMRAGPDPVYGEQAFWYSALAQLQLGDRTASQRYLEQLLALSGNFKVEEAKVILAELKIK